MTLYVINRSSAITMQDVLTIVPSGFNLEVKDDIAIITDTQGTFGNNPRAVYLTDDTDSILGYAGATYPYGAVTVYDIAGTMQRIGGSLGKHVVLLRIWHEILHHYNQDADGLDGWLADKPVLRFLYGISSPEKWIGAMIQQVYYRYLTEKIDMDTFDETNRISDRNYQGLLL